MDSIAWQVLALVISQLFALISAHVGRYVIRFAEFARSTYSTHSVAIDAKLPTYPDGTLMCMSTELKRELWPSLIEKAVS